MALLYLTDDLLFSSQITTAAQAASFSLEWTPTLEKFFERLHAAPTRLVIVDLGMRGVDPASLVAEIRAAHPSARIVAYGPHVQVEKLERAEQAGCDEVLPRGALSREIVAVLRRHLG